MSMRLETLLVLSVLLKILQISCTARNIEPEKQTRRRNVTPLGRPSRKGLCWEVKMSRASAWIPYFSSVQDVRKSQCCFCSHQIAWSDQSCWISGSKHTDSNAGELTHHVKQNILTAYINLHLKHILIFKICVEYLITWLHGCLIIFAMTSVWNRIFW